MARGSRQKKRKLWRIPLGIVIVIIILFAVYVSVFYKADQTALEALESDDSVAVMQTEYGWKFDGPSEDTALIFYPGAKVDEKAYAAFLHTLAADGADVCLVKMPFHLAFFGINKADSVMSGEAYPHWYIGGHSLGGAMAASYAAEHGEALDGVILCAAYPTKPLDANLTEVLIYGSEDQVLNLENVDKGAQYAPKDLTEYVIAGGNHAQFGDYGEQKGDGTAVISAEKQQEEAVRVIAGAIASHQ